jgi:hypothetical protein
VHSTLSWVNSLTAFAIAVSIFSSGMVFNLQA